MLKVFSSLGCALFLFWSFTIADARASEPLFFNASLPKNSFQLARSTFLPDKADDLGLSDFDSIDADFSDDNCAAYPYSACPEGATCEACPLDMSKYRIKSCQAPYLQSGDNCVCPPAVELSNPNDECTQYCGTTCISKKCTSSPSQSSCTVGVKNCDDGCGFMTRYCCMDCKDTITTKPENSSFTYSSCKDGTGTHDIKTGWTCNSGFHENQGVCEKNCISNNCSGYTLPSCPSHATCSKCTVTSGDCSSGDTKYKINSCDSGYKISGGSCVPAEASVGDILFSDMTTSPELVSGKTPIGIVFDPSRKIAMSLTHSDIIRFVEEDDSTVGYISQLRDNDISGYKTYTPPYESGQSNTSILLDFGESKNLHFSAAKYCNNYTTPGTAAGSWFLPSHYEVIYPLQTYEDKISAAYNLVGEKSIIYSRYWTSSIDNSLKSSIRMDGNYSFYQPYGEPIPSHIDDPTSNYFWRSYAYCGINYGKKSCSVQTCSTYTLSSCPSHGICSTCTIRDENCNTGSNKYKLDSCETGYVMQGNSCSRLILPLPILYSDLTTSYELFPNKTAIGVVFDTNLKRAVSLVKHKEKWGTQSYNVSIETQEQALNNFDGKGNTSKLLAQCTSCPAVKYATSYSTAGTKAGDWYVPAYGELDKIKAQQNNINVVLKALGVDSLLTDDYYWSSSLGSQTNPWRLFFTNAYSYNFGNDLTENYIRPVIAYTQNSCSVGDVLYSDRTCSDVSKLNSDKTAIGVVFSPDKKLAIALNSQTKTWTGAFYDVPGINNVTIPTTDLDGKTNTKTLVEFSSANQMSFPAASYAYSYTTQGTSTRDWYLPAGAELQLIFNEKEKLNETLSALGAQILENSYFWSSSEYATKYAWRLYFGTSTSTWQYVSKNTQCLVRPVLQY